MKTAIEMARECHIAAYIELSDPGSIAQELERALLSGEYDHYGMHKSALAMHTMRQAEIDELVEGLSAAVQILQCLEPQPNISAQGISLTDLLTKHRPDAFAK